MSTTLIPVLDFLSQHEGLYQGAGTNFENEAFQAKFELKSRLDSLLVELIFRAQDSDNAFHEEITWITNDLIEDRIALWSVSSNMPGMLRHTLSEDKANDYGGRTLVFRHGDLESQHGFRQEIAIDFHADGSIVYRYGWGVPHEKFAPRTRATLKLQRNS